MKQNLMKRPIIKFLAVIIVIAGVSSLSSCYTEQSLGARFVSKAADDAIPVWFIGASYIFHSCSIPADSMGDGCIMVSEHSDSVLLEKYNRAFAMLLADYGFRVYSYYEADAFLSHPGSGLIINIAQLELEEAVDVYSDSEVFDTLEYFESFPVRVFRVNSWIEVSGVDTARENQEVFYATSSLSDIIEGYFIQKQFSGDVYYTYRRFDMRPSLTGKFVESTGEEHAQKLFDVWMNRYIKRNSADSQKTGIYFSDPGYYHYNKKKRRIEPVSPSHALQKL